MSTDEILGDFPTSAPTTFARASPHPAAADSWLLGRAYGCLLSLPARSRGGREHVLFGLPDALAYRAHQLGALERLRSQTR